MENQNKLELFKIRDLRKKDQFKLDDLYLNGYARVCGKNSTLAYVSLCRHAQYHTQQAFPAQEKMAYEHNISIKPIREGIRKLIEYNIISIEKERWGGKFINYVYTLLDKSQWKKIS